MHFIGLALAALCQLCPTPGTASLSLASPRTHCLPVDFSAPKSCWAEMANCPWGCRTQRYGEAGVWAGSRQASGERQGGLLASGISCWGHSHEQA